VINNLEEVLEEVFDSIARALSLWGCGKCQKVGTVSPVPATNTLLNVSALRPLSCNMTY
jgi:hypothetical protein